MSRSWARFPEKWTEKLLTFTFFHSHINPQIPYSKLLDCLYISSQNSPLLSVRSNLLNATIFKILRYYKHEYHDFLWSCSPEGSSASVLTFSSHAYLLLCWDAKYQVKGATDKASKHDAKCMLTFERHKAWKSKWSWERWGCISLTHV